MPRHGRLISFSPTGFEIRNSRLQAYRALRCEYHFLGLTSGLQPKANRFSRAF